MPKEDWKFRLLILNQVLLWSNDFRGEGSGNEDNFFNSGCCAGPRFQAGKVPLLSPALSFSMRSAAHSGHPVFYDTVRQTAEKSIVSGVLGSNSSGTPLLAHCADSGAPLLRASRGPGSQFADDRLAASDELVRDERVHDLLRCAGSSGMLVLRACGTDGSSGKPTLETCSSGCAADEPGDLLAKTGVAGYEREHSALQVSPAAAVGEHLSLQVYFASRKPVAERDQLGGPVASRLRHQARSSCLDLRCLSDFVSSSRLCHLFPSPRLVDARVGHTNASVDTNFARVNSWGTLHAARTNSGGHANSYRCTYNSCGGVRGGTKPRSMSTRDQVGCLAVEKLASLQQAPGRLHVETWAGRNKNSNLPISQAVEIMSGCVDMVVCLHPPFFSSVSPGPGREVRNGIGWSLLEKNSQVGSMVVPGCLAGKQCVFCIYCICWVGAERIVPYSVGGPPSFLVFLFILVWARHGYRATIWRAVLATA